MPWRADVARRLHAHMEPRRGGQRVMLTPGGREVETLRAILPGALEVELPRGAATGIAGRPYVSDALSPDLPVAPGTGDLLHWGGISVGEGAVDVAIVWLATMRLSTALRRRLLLEVRHALRVGGILCVVDHNRPRGWWTRAWNAGWCLVQGVEPWRRPAYPVAREIQAVDFQVISLHLACSERIQIVWALHS